MKLCHLPLVLMVLGLLAGCASNEPAPIATEEPDITIDAADAVVASDEGTEVTLYVTREGFVPANVSVPAGKRVTLLVTRKTERTCATELVMSEHGIDQELPFDETVEITFTPEVLGDIHYACAMDMITGTITVE